MEGLRRGAGVVLPSKKDDDTGLTTRCVGRAGAAAKFLAGGRVEQQPSSTMMIDARKIIGV